MTTAANRKERTLVWPLILIGIGALLLLNNLGLVGWDVWGFLARYWPVLLIAAGADILMGGRSRGLVVAGALIVILVMWFGWNTTGATAGTVGGGTTDISQGLEGARSASIRLAPGVARLDLSAGDDRDLLIGGTVRTGRNETVDQAFRLRGDDAVYSLASRSAGPNFRFFTGNERREWDLQLSPAVPVELDIDAGVGQIRLDLAELQLTGLSLDTGVGESLVILPGRGRYAAQIDSGVGEVTVRIPRGFAARIHADRGVGNVTVSGEFERDGASYVSPNYENAQSRVDLRVNGGVGSIDIETY